ncbi:DNA photolyase family protein [Roseibacterium sp. SDUM158016]|uniref:cryptochrome/photolyase family protein n=1 Tax=Roseicyclus sediminis TaxID=2980997 RepID=UPI0021D104FB|nr:deoxyribodipyrimidine photo-lyase [Roseibacterium sp. SDUM158016]MCU4654514.1 DNA photolyase family protein [Roseibacterium sp. SDUM158016]
MTRTPILYWARRDFRLGDNPALCAAAASGCPVIPVFVVDEVMEGHGAAPKWRLGLGAEAFGAALAGAGSRLIVRRGRALDVLRALIAETGAREVHWNRLYDPAARRRDEAVKAALKAEGVEARSHGAHVLFEPWTVATGVGGFYRVYTPFWKAVRGRDPGEPLAVPKLAAPEVWPASEDIAGMGLGDAMRRGAEIVRPYLAVGEEAARGRLGAFIAEGIADYADRRDDLARDGTSHLSENLTHGEISARTCWWAGMRAMEQGKPGAETFLKELVWRDFAHHLVHHTPHIVETNWREDWDAFPWNEDAGREDVRAWRRGRTGMQVVDAAMREMYVTGRMHNRARMLVASYLCKHLLTHWKIGLDWFEDCLVDWDPASNAMGWQWSAGSGPDAAPYFRVFNPETQAEKFDPHGRYRRRWVAELSSDPPQAARSYFDAIPESWGMSAADRYPARPVVDTALGRQRALDAYSNRSF